MTPSRHPGRIIQVLLLLSLLFTGASSLAQDPAREAETQAKITELQRQIAAMQRKIDQQQGEKNTLQKRLQATETELGRISNSLKAVETAIEQELPKLAALDRERKRLDAEVDMEEARMTGELRNLWALQQGGSLRVLFGDQGPDQLARNLAYYRLLLTSRSEAITQFTALLDAVAENAKALQASQRRLAQQRETLEQQRASTVALQAERKATLASIEKSLTSDNARMARMEADAARLSNLLEELRRTLEELDTPTSYKPFTQAKGKMPLPLGGRPSNRFGGKRNAGNMRWRGWLIPARSGSDVKAIHHGRVVYADWLRGQGLLLIIDHGEGYLSLYGHNRSLQREVGDWVGPGDVIATVGASGGAESPALYFEIRHKGEPINPGQWLAR